jgi:hypothetical protein
VRIYALHGGKVSMNNSKKRYDLCCVKNTGNIWIFNYYSI